jgi:tRNA pseudouridine32 synthase/23S rRNA pseudouridine746 synthase/23S rRNA pseudouridine1911/1915/1917 synthase
VAGDKKYGNTAPLGKRLMLHARSLTFIHPHSGKEMRFELGMPEEFSRLLGK